MQARQIYHAALARMLVTARDERRFRAGVGIEIDAPEGHRCLPLTIHGFPWAVTDFQDLHPVGEYATPLTGASTRGVDGEFPSSCDEPCRPEHTAKTVFCFRA